jgi:hypothetical protein
VFAAKQHLDDNVLIRRYLAERGLAALDAGDEGPLRHLAHCHPCEARYQALRVAFDETREAAVADRILRRIDALHAGPRVLPFPAAVQSGQAGHQPRVFRRWVAAAAVAGLLVGLGAGRMVFYHDTSTTADAGEQQTSAPASGRQAPVMQALHVEPAADDEEFLSEIELATAAPRTQELRAIYAFTLEGPRDVPRTVGKD